MKPAQMPWPRHPTGRPKTMAEMSYDERRAVFLDAVKQIELYFKRPDVQAGIVAFMQSNIQ